jgi:phosphate transport system permease protein
LFGLVGYLFFGVYMDTGVSWVTGSLILAVMILPTLQVSIREAVETLPEKYREAGMALGLSRATQIWRIILPQSFYGLVTGVLLGLARAAGETAAIMFTATTFSGIQFPQSFSDPVPTLQTHILVLAQEAANPESIAQAWGAGLVLLGLVFLLTLAAWSFRTRLVMESEL